LLQAFAVGADGITRAGNDINRQRLRNTCLARRFCYLAQGIQQIDPELKGGSEAAERIGDVFIDLGRVARYPIGFRAHRFKLLVVGAEGQGMDERAPAAWPQAQPLNVPRRKVPRGVWLFSIIPEHEPQLKLLKKHPRLKRVSLVAMVCLSRTLGRRQVPRAT
jgi:hypothetical protein